MITCLHTADVHVATFAALLPDARHVVRADFLERARVEGVDSVAGEVTVIMRELAVVWLVPCTCSTSGPLVDELDNPSVKRLDGPATLASFDTVAAGRARAKLVLCDGAWPHFEAGDMAAFAQRIADCVSGQGTQVLSAQASMVVAAPLLEKQGVTVFTTPKAAAEVVAALT